MDSETTQEVYADGVFTSVASSGAGGLRLFWSPLKESAPLRHFGFCGLRFVLTVTITVTWATMCAPVSGRALMDSLLGVDSSGVLGH